jgi:hypothetical protein
MKRLAIIGSRSFNDYNLMESVLSPFQSQLSLVVSGGAKGADLLGERWAKNNNIKTLIFYADWNRYGRSAGFKRNEDIINNADMVIAFWDGKSPGTKHSISLANKFKIPLRIINYLDLISN